MTKSIKLTMILLSGITILDSALAQNLCVNNRGDTKVASRCPRGYRAVLNLRRTVTEQKLANTPLVTSGSIRPEAVIGSIHIAPKSILGAQIGDGVIETRHIARIHASKIEGLGSFELQPNSVDTQHLKDNAVTSSKIAAEAVGDREVSSISHEKIRWTGWTLEANSVGEAQVRDEAITTAKIKNETIKNEDIAQDANIDWAKIEKPRDGIPGAEIANGAITEAKLANGTITAAKLADGAVTNQKFSNRPEDRLHHSKIDFTGYRLAANTVNSESIVDRSIQAADLANNAITSQQIADNTIRDADIAPDARIAFSKIAIPQGGIPGSNIAAGSIGAAQLAANAVDSTKISDGAITNSKLNLDLKIPPFHTFVNYIILDELRQSSNHREIVKYYSFSNPLASGGYQSLYSQLFTGQRLYVPFANYPNFRCTRFALSVVHWTPFRENGAWSGVREFTLVANSAGWGSPTIELQEIGSQSPSILRLSQSWREPHKATGTIEGVFRLQNQIVAPAWVAVKVKSYIRDGEELMPNGAQITVSCKP